MNSESIVFSEVASYIEEYDNLSGDISHVFKLTDQHVLYRKRLDESGGDTTQYIHATRLAQILHQYITTQEVHRNNTGTVLTFKK